VIGLGGGIRVMVSTRPVDFRKGAEGLAALVREEMKSDPFSGVVYVFRAKRADRVKLVYWDGNRRVPVRKAARGRQVPVAECAGRRHSPVSCAARGLAGRSGLETRSRSAGDTGADAAGMIAAE
jgi:IS66 Orf2 like protein